MKYSIFYLIRGEAEKYNQQLVKTVGPMFDENYMIEHPLPVHITLKAPFETDKINDLEVLLSEFVKKQKIGKIRVRDFGNFKRFVAFMETKFDSDSKRIQRNLVKEIEDNEIAKLHEFDRKHNPHSTIAYGNTKKSFDGIWSYLQTLEKPDFDLVFDRVAIMKKMRGKWEVYREFKIKN